MKNALANLRERLGMPALAGNSRGFTLIEIIIVVALLATLLAILVTNITQRAESAKEDASQIAMAKVAQALSLYKVHNNKYPTTEQGLQALLQDPGGDSKRWRGPYMDQGEVKDGWANDLGYESDGNTYKIICTTPSGKQLTYPPSEEGKEAIDEPAK
jgi:general secretion pathway protein G